MSGSITRGKDNPSQSLQMVERALMTPDELKSMPRGEFIVMKTGVRPMKVHLKLFFKWGIEFDEEHPYTVTENGNRKVEYAEKSEIQSGIIQKYHPEAVFDEPEPSEKANGSQAQEQTPVRETPKRDIPRRNTDSKKRGSGESPSLPELPEHSIQEVRSNRPS
jgi:type IV secretion system protein VirD4